MSIGYKKLAGLIDVEVDEISELSADYKVILSDLCKKLYMMESSQQSRSTQKLIEEMSGEIGNTADKLNCER